MPKEFMAIGPEIDGQVSADGQSIRLIFQGGDGEQIGIELPPGYLPIMIGKIMSAARVADERRQSSVAGSIMDTLSFGATQRPKELRVGQTSDGGNVVVQLQLSDLPFTLALTREEALELAQLIAAAAKGLSVQMPQ